MKLRLLPHLMLPLAPFLSVLLACGEGPANPRVPDAPPIAWSVTVFPIVLNSGAPIPGVPADMSKKVAEIVGLCLERAGMKEVEIADAQFSPPEKGDPAEVAEAFGRFVQSQNLKTEYALYGQFFGTLGKGVDEIRLAVVDRQGKVVLAERLDRQQLLLKRLLSGEKRVDPMSASGYLVSRLQALWGLADPNRKDVPEGKMFRLWSEKSGLPPKSERDTIELRLMRLKKTIQTSTVAVYPVRVSGKSDRPLAARLAQMLADAGLGRARAADADPKLQIQGNTNQTRILWDTARAFQTFLRKNPPAADYALLAEYGMGRSADGKPLVGGVQFVICDHNGDWVLVGLRNDHHPDFQRMNPQSPDQCNRLVVEAIAKMVREPPAAAMPEKGVVPAKDEKLRQELLGRAAEDQRARQEIIKYLRQHKGNIPDGAKDTAPPIVTTMREIDRRNTARMKEIVDRYGWPGIALVGKDGEQAAYLLVQHADQDHAFQKRCLVLLTEAVKSGQALAEHMAYLTDRVRVAEKQKQLYGTQLHYAGGRLEPDTIEDETHVDSRRQAVGLPPLAKYLDMSAEIYGAEPGAKPN